MNNHRLVELINGALRNNDNLLRAQAQAQIIQFRANQTVNFFLGCAELFINENEEEFVRRSAATLLSRSTSLKANIANNPFFWDLLSSQIKIKIKEMVLSTLISPNQLIMKDAANAISHIALVQIPRGEWLNITEILAENTQHSDINVRKASVITIGLICQQFHFANVQVDAGTCQQFLGGVVIGSRQKQNPQIVEASIKALSHSLAFLKPIIHQALYRDEIFKLLYEYLNSQNYSQTSYEALYEFCKSAYEYLDKYIHVLLEIIINHIQQRNDNTISALEVLDTIGTEFLDRMQELEGRANQNFNIPNYLTPLQNRIMPEIMRCLLIENQDDLDFPEMRNSAAKTIGTMIAVGDNQTIQIVLNGVNAIVQGNNIGHQQGSAILLSTICQSPNREFALKCISANFDKILQLLTSNQKIVVLNTLNGMVTISETFPQVFLNHQFLKDIIDKLFAFLSIQSNTPQKVNIITTVLSVFRNITEGVTPNSMLLSDPNILLTKLVSFYEEMLDNFDGPNKDYSEKVVISIMNCLMKIRSRETLIFMIDFLINKYQFFFQKNVQDLEIILQSILSIMNTSVLALQNTVPKVELMNRIITVIDNHIKRFGIQDEGINMISCLVVVFSKSFQRYAEKYWPHVMHGLESINQPKVFRASIQCVGDYSRVYADSFMDKQNQIMSRLLSLIHQNIDRTLKSYILSCIGDLALGLGIMTEGYIEEILKVCNLCFGAVYQLSNNPNQKEYVQELKKSLIDMYACVSFALNSKNQRNRSINKNILEHFPLMATFVVRTCSREQNPTIDYLKSCLYLVFDSVSFFWSNQSNRSYLKQIIQNDSIRGLVAILDNFSHQDDIRELQALIQQRYACSS